jgi:hypothetical protein
MLVGATHSLLGKLTPYPVCFFRHDHMQAIAQGSYSSSTTAHPATGYYYIGYLFISRFTFIETSGNKWRTERGCSNNSATAYS